MKPKVTIICSVRNKENYIEETIESVLGQTYRDFEFIVYDDHSTDDTLAKLLSYEDSRLVVIASIENKGQAARIHELIKMARGEYIGWIDGDDSLDRRCIELCAEVLDSHSSYGLVYTDHYEIDSRGFLQGIGNRSMIPYSPENLLLNFMTFHFRMFRRDVYDYCEKIDTSLRSAGDYDLCLKMSEVTKFIRLPLPLYYYRYTEESESVTNLKLMAETTEYILKNTLKRRKMDHIKVELEYEGDIPRYKYSVISN